jgi:metallo-beta-lactamase class B
LPQFTRRYQLVFLLGLASLFALVLVGRWLNATKRGGQGPAEPFRIAGNLYYVGATDLTAFLLTGPDGDVLIAGGYPTTASLFMASIAQLGFDVSDVKVLVNSQASGDNAGALAALQHASGAQLWVSDRDADVVAAGGAGGASFGPLRFLTFLPFLNYPAPRVDHRFKDGETIRVGPIALTAHVMGNPSDGCTTWSFPIRDGDRVLLGVHACHLEPPFALSPDNHPEVRTAFERSFDTLRSLPADIWVTSHAREFGRYRKFVARGTARNPADPFIDRQGYLDFIDQSEKRFSEREGKR